MAQALRLIEHRGPDGIGYWEGDGVRMGCCRLAVRTRSPRAAQPLCDSERRIVLVANGEVYNDKELIRALSKNARVRVTTDVELFIHLYLAHGVDFCRNVEGEFAVALWDRRCRRLVIARDPIGVKPLFVSVQPDGIAWSSEVKALLALTRSPRADMATVADYLVFGYPVSKATFYGDVRPLPRGHILTWSPEERRAHTRRYAPQGRTRAAQRPGAFGEALVDSVRARLTAAVPVGMHLSGGLDSSAVAHIASRYARTTPPSFTATFSERHPDVTYSRRVAAETGSDRTIVRMSADYVCAHFDDVVSALDSPIMSPGVFTIDAVAAAASAEGIKVLLSGQGADELLFGYERFKSIDALPRSSLFRLCANTSPKLLRGVIRRSGDGKRLWEHIRATTRRFDRVAAAGSNRERVQRFYLDSFLQELLRTEDHVHMRWGIENRVPFLSAAVVASAFDQRGSLTLGLKLPLRQLLRSSSSVAARRRYKRQMAIPLRSLSAWMRRRLAMELYDGAASIPGVNYDVIRSMIAHPVTRTDLRVLWSIVNLHAWRTATNVEWR